MPHFMPKLPVTPARSATRLPFHFLLVACLLALCGCTAPTDVVRPIHVAGGRVLGIPFGPNGPRPGRANGYEVAFAGIGPGPTDRELIYRFAVTIPPGSTPQNIKVEDISDELAWPLIDDLHPWVEEKIWHIETLPIKSDDPRLAWVLNVSLSIRVFRITILDDASRRSVLYQVTVYPDYLKAAIRQKWGEKY
jgi:hypothetical protein